VKHSVDFVRYSYELARELLAFTWDSIAIAPYWYAFASHSFVFARFSVAFA